MALHSALETNAWLEPHQVWSSGNMSVSMQTELKMLNIVKNTIGGKLTEGQVQQCLQNTSNIYALDNTPSKIP